MPRGVLDFDRVMLLMLLAILAGNITTSNLEPNDLLETMKNVEEWLSETCLYPPGKEEIQAKIDEIKALVDKTDWASQAQAPLYELVGLLSYEE